MPKRSPGAIDEDDINKRLGVRLRLSREMAGMSQTDVGNVLGVSFQQIQKYENGTTSISLNRLGDIAACFRLPINQLVDGLDLRPQFAAGMGFAESEQAAYEAGADPVFKPGPLSKEKVNLIHAFGRLPSPKVRRCLVSLLEALAAEGENEPVSEEP